MVVSPPCLDGPELEVMPLSALLSLLGLLVDAGSGEVEPLSLWPDLRGETRPFCVDIRISELQILP